MPRRSTRVFLTPSAILRIKFVARMEGMTFSQAVNALMHRGYELRKKERS